MYPCYEDKKQNNGDIWKDAVQYISASDIKQNFFSDNPDHLTGDQGIRKTPDGVHEAWFLSGEKNAFGGQLERQLLAFWLKV